MKNFESFVNAVVARLSEIYQETPDQITSCRSGEDFELCVFNAANDVVLMSRTDAIVHYTQGSHAFPDIIIEYNDGDRYGIEVKCSTSSTAHTWKINGNSVLGSTKEDVIDTYIVFGKTKPGHVGFRFRRYEDAISNVVVTHSPRYLIDMDVDNQSSFFRKSGLTYNQMCQSDNPIGLITEYFRSQGQQAWWLSESTPAAIRIFCDLSANEKAEVVGYCFAHFPEVFSNGTKKFARSSMWLATERSVVAPSLRDSFTAGGRRNVLTNHTTYRQLPKIFLKMQQHKAQILRELEQAESQKLYEDWYSNPNKCSPIIKTLDSIDRRIEIWLQKVTDNINSNDEWSYISYEITPMVKDILMG